jgi:hypothetical protein
MAHTRQSRPVSGLLAGEKNAGQQLSSPVRAKLGVSSNTFRQIWTLNSCWMPSFKTKNAGPRFSRTAKMRRVSSFGPTGVPCSKETTPPWDAAVGVCLGPYGGAREWASLYEGGTLVSLPHAG